MTETEVRKVELEEQIIESEAVKKQLQSDMDEINSEFDETSNELEITKVQLLERGRNEEEGRRKTRKVVRRAEQEWRWNGKEWTGE